jgi:hypothetical protein
MSNNVQRLGEHVTAIIGVGNIGAPAPGTW